MAGQYARKARRGEARRDETRRAAQRSAAERRESEGAVLPEGGEGGRAVQRCSDVVEDEQTMGGGSPRASACRSGHGLSTINNGYQHSVGMNASAGDVGRRSGHWRRRGQGSVKSR